MTRSATPSSHRRPAADSGRRRLGQDARHHAPHRVHHRRRPREAGRSARRHVHEQGRRGNARRASSSCSARTAGRSGSRRFTRCARGCCAARRRRSGCRATSSSTTRPTSSPSSSRRMKALDIDDKLIQPRAALSRISQAKNRMESPDDLRSAGWSLRDQQIARIYEAYRRTLSDAGALDFDDLLLKTVELVETSERVRELLRAEVPLRPRRRIPGHEPAAVHADPPARRSPSQPLRRRRSGSVDLQVARRGPAQHPRLRARLSRTRRSSGSSRTTDRRR